MSDDDLISVKELLSTYLEAYPCLRNVLALRKASLLEAAETYVSDVANELDGYDSPRTGPRCEEGEQAGTCVDINYRMMRLDDAAGSAVELLRAHPVGQALADEVERTEGGVSL